MSRSTTQAVPISAALRRDLSLVLPALEPPAPLSDEALKAQAMAVAQQLNTARAPAVVGLGRLSIEAARWAVALAERVRGRLLPHPLPAGLSTHSQSVTQTATLGHVFASNLIIWVGCTGADGPVAQAIAARQLKASFTDATLDAVLKLRREFEGGAAIPGDAKRIAVVLGPSCDDRVASQWHKLAATVQQRVRMAVMRLPDIARDQNMRGVLEVITWQNGLSCTSGAGGGGIDFADGAPRPCPGYDVLHAAGQIDYTFEPAGIFVPCAARVMRFDGIVLWLCDDPATAPPDPTATLIEAVYHRTRRRP